MKLAVPKALAIMILAAFGSGLFHGGVRSTYDFDSGFEVGLGVFLLLGAWFLYRAWFDRLK